MTNNKDEINRRIHELRGNHVHAFKTHDDCVERVDDRCGCGTFRCDGERVTNYFSPTTPRGELDDAVEKAVEKFGAVEMGSALARQVIGGAFEFNPDITHYDVGNIATASPEQICLAIDALMKEEK